MHIYLPTSIWSTRAFKALEVFKMQNCLWILGLLFQLNNYGFFCPMWLILKLPWEKALLQRDAEKVDYIRHGVSFKITHIKVNFIHIWPRYQGKRPEVFQQKWRPHLAAYTIKHSTCWVHLGEVEILNCLSYAWYFLGNIVRILANC